MGTGCSIDRIALSYPRVIIDVQVANCGDDVGVFKPGQGCFISAPWQSLNLARAAARASTWTSHDAATGVIFSHLGPAAAKTAAMATTTLYECDFCGHWFTNSHKWKTLQSYKGVCAHICQRCTSKWKDENPKTYAGSIWDEAGRQVVKDDIEITFGRTTKCFEQGHACSGAPYMKKDDKEKKDDNGEKNDDQDKPLF